MSMLYFIKLMMNFFIFMSSYLLTMIIVLHSPKLYNKMKNLYDKFKSNFKNKK